MRRLKRRRVRCVAWRPFMTLAQMLFIYLFLLFSVHGWFSVFLLNVDGLRGDWPSFCRTGVGRVGRVWSAREWIGCKIHLFSHWAIMPRATESTDSEIHSFSHWAIMPRATESTDSEIHSSSHWAIMERTDSEIHSFSHWAILTRPLERADSEIHSFSHWAIMTDFVSDCWLLYNFPPGTPRTESEDKLCEGAEFQRFSLRSRCGGNCGKAKV